jgi:hypothetical protein
MLSRGKKACAWSMYVSMVNAMNTRVDRGIEWECCVRVRM